MNVFDKGRYEVIFRSLALVVLPLCLGSFVYIFLRAKKPELLSKFSVFENLSINCEKISVWVCDNYFLKNNFADAAWAFALMAAISMSVEKEKPLIKNLYTYATIATIVLLEVLQIKHINGTFDVLDLIWELIAVAFCVAILRRKNSDQKPA